MSPTMSKGNINAMASVAGNLIIKRGTAKTPRAPAKADFETPISTTTVAINTIVIMSILMLRR